MDRSKQFARTDRDIMKAVLTLVDRMPFEKITVSDIVEEAMINRSTFYLHFQDKYAVMERLEENYIEQLSDLFNRLHGGNDGLGAMDSVIRNYFVRHSDVLKRLMKTEDFEKRIRALARDYIKQMVKGVSASELEMLTSMIVSFFFYVIEHPETEGSFSTRFMEDYLDITVRFFRLDRLPDGKERLKELIGEANVRGREEQKED